jgi:hypothetical protein
MTILIEYIYNVDVDIYFLNNDSHFIKFEFGEIQNAR